MVAQVADSSAEGESLPHYKGFAPVDSIVSAVAHIAYREDESIDSASFPNQTLAFDV